MMEAEPHIEPELDESPALQDVEADAVATDAVDETEAPESDESDAAAGDTDTSEGDAGESAAHAPLVLDHAQLVRLVEAVLFAAAEPLTLDAVQARLPRDTDAKPLLAEVESLYADRGVNLVRVAGKFMLRTAPDLVDALKIERTVKRKLSRAAIETLAIIAYHQPVTRAEVEEIRGVELSRGTLDLLMEAGWIKPRGHRETPGRPALWATTEEFLLHFGIDKLDDLPGVEELKAAGLLDARPAVSAYSEEAGLTFADPPGESEENAADEPVVDDDAEPPLPPESSGHENSGQG